MLCVVFLEQSLRTTVVLRDKIKLSKNLKHVPESKTIHFWILASVFGFCEVFLDSGTCFGFWEVFLDSGTWFGFWGAVLDSGTCFGFWEVFSPYEPP